MKKIIYQLVLILLCFCATACGWECTEFLKLHNNSHKAIYVVAKQGKTDTVYSSLSNCVIDHIFPNDYEFVAEWNGRKEQGPNDFSWGADTLRIMIFREVHDYYRETDTLNLYNVVLARYDVSYNDIKNLKFDLTYPPTENMRYIHMYPTYEEIIEKYQQ